MFSYFLCTDELNNKHMFRYKTIFVVISLYFCYLIITTIENIKIIHLKK